jgi:hypothetical protein
LAVKEDHRIEIQFDDRCFEALEDEAKRLGLEIEELVTRAASAWLCDITEGCVGVSISLATR